MKRVAKAKAGTTSTVRTRRAQWTRDEILRASLKVFSEKGFGASRMEDIALELQATRGLLYYHFKTKEEILDAVMAKFDVMPGLDEFVASSSAMPLRQALEAIVQISLDTMAANPELVRFLHVHSLLSAAEAEVVYRRVMRGAFEMLAQVFERFKRDGQIREDVSPDSAAQIVILQLVVHFVARGLFGPSDVDEATYRDQLLRILVAGIGRSE